MTDNPHFANPGSWEAAEAMLTFRPLRPRETAGFGLESLAVHVRDYKRREIAIGNRSLEAHYGGFVVSQQRVGKERARRRALSVSYGAAAFPAKIVGHEGRAYELGPEVPPDDSDGRSPAVVVWHDGEMLYLVASGELPVQTLVGIAVSMYAPDPTARR